MRVSMIQIPAMVAFQHGAGGVAAFLVSYVELTREAMAVTGVEEVSGILGVVIGAATFSGSMIASGKLSGVLKQTPVLLPHHSRALLATAVITVGLAVLSGVTEGAALHSSLLALLAFSILLGVVFSVRIGGADMPVLISFLNATAGLAAAFCGIIIGNRLLIACGATVAASGSVLTHVMCQAMNRGLSKVFTGIAVPKGPLAPALAMEASRGPASAEGEAEEARQPAEAPLARATRAVREAETVIIIPGYGMALARAQFETVGLARRLTEMGKEVKFAIHPVAGRMPGHMHVLLAEAEVDSDQLFDMDEVNREFKSADAVLVVGACDVLNPAAIQLEGTPISGMPILMAHEVIICNLDAKPGYSGVANPLYDDAKTICLFGDAKATLTELLEKLA